MYSVTYRVVFILKKFLSSNSIDHKLYLVGALDQVTFFSVLDSFFRREEKLPKDRIKTVFKFVVNDTFIKFIFVI